MEEASENTQENMNPQIAEEHWDKDHLWQAILHAIKASMSDRRSSEILEAIETIAKRREAQAAHDAAKKVQSLLRCREDIDGTACDCCQANWDAIEDAEPYLKRD